MKKFIFCFFTITLYLLIHVSDTSAQDLIVTTQGDSLNVEIVKVTEETILYIYKEGKKVKRVTSPKSDIKSYQYIFFSEERTLEYIFDPNNIDFRLAFSGGPSWGTDGPPENANNFFKEYIKKVNSGWSYKVEFNYFIKDRFAIGAVFDQFFTKEKINNVFFIDNITNDTITGVLSDDVKISYLGPHFTYHIDTRRDNFTLFFGAGAGPIWYSDDFRRVDEFRATGTTWGYHLSLSTDFILMNNLMMGVEVSGTIGTLRSFEVVDDNGPSTITDDNDITRINVALGFRFIK